MRIYGEKSCLSPFAAFFRHCLENREPWGRPPCTAGAEAGKMPLERESVCGFQSAG